jgi:hypothetical protein
MYCLEGEPDSRYGPSIVNEPYHAVRLNWQMNKLVAINEAYHAGTFDLIEYV